MSDGSAFLDGWKYTPVAAPSRSGTRLTAGSASRPSTAPRRPPTAPPSRSSPASSRTPCSRSSSTRSTSCPNTPGSLDPNGIHKVGSVTGYMTPGQIADITSLYTHDYIAEFSVPTAPTATTCSRATCTRSSTGLPARVAPTPTHLLCRRRRLRRQGHLRGLLGREDLHRQVRPRHGLHGQPRPVHHRQARRQERGLELHQPAAHGCRRARVGRPRLPPVWQYRNASGNWIDVPTGAKFSAVALNDDTITSVTLRAKWEADEGHHHLHDADRRYRQERRQRHQRAQPRLGFRRTSTPCPVRPMP